MKKIAVIGAGWYGCHIAKTLIERQHNVTIFESGNSIFSGASKRNQNRLHLGFHYPRDYATRSQSMDGYKWFRERYAHLIQPVHNNYYAIARNGSHIDYHTYLQIMQATGLSYEIPIDPLVELVDVEGLIQVDEMLINNELAKNFFWNELNDHIFLNSMIDLSDRSILDNMRSEFNYVIDCTWQTANRLSCYNVYYEPCVYFYYKNRRLHDFALTVMDGPFVSLYPYSKDIYTLTSVEHTPIGQFENYDIAKEAIFNIQNSSAIELKKVKFEEAIKRWYPAFDSHFEYVAPEFSMKTKIQSSTDFRGTLVHSESRLISIFSGKIDTINIAENIVLGIIQ